MTILEHLVNIRACPEASEWVCEQVEAKPNVTLQELWDRCPNGAWLVWYLRRTKYPEQLPYNKVPDSFPEELRTAAVKEGWSGIQWWDYEDVYLDADLVRRFFPQVPE